MKPNYQLTLSLGPDKIPARLLKDSCFSIVPFLTQIFNASLASSVFHKTGKLPVFHQSIKRVISEIVVTTDRYRCYQLSLDYLRK